MSHQRPYNVVPTPYAPADLMRKFPVVNKHTPYK